MSHCDHLTLSQYLDGELALPAAVAARAHLKECRRCSDELGELQRVNRLLSTHGARPAPVSQRSVPRPRPTWERRQRFGPLLSLSRITPAAVGTTAAALLLVATASLGSLLHGQQSALSSTVALRSPGLVRVSQPLALERRSTAVGGTQGIVFLVPRLRPLVNET